MARLIDGKPLTMADPASQPDLVPYPLLAQWQRAGNNVNQIARAIHRGRTVEATWIVSAMKELLALMIEDQITMRFAARHGAKRLASRAAALG